MCGTNCVNEGHTRSRGEFALTDILSAVVEAVPERPAVIWRDTTLTYAGVARAVESVAHGLRRAGLGRVEPRATIPRWKSGQDHVALLMRNRPEWLVAMMGAYRARTIPFNVNYRYTPVELRQLFVTARPRAVIYESSYAPVLAEIVDGFPELVLWQVGDDSDTALLPHAEWFDNIAETEVAETDLPDCSPDDGYLLLTGGTTGLPKGVLWRQADIFVAAMGGRMRSGEVIRTIDQVVDRIPDSPRRTLPTPPFMHAAAQWNACSALLAGDTVVIQSVVDRLDADDVWKTVGMHEVKMLVIVGDAFARPLLDQLSEHDYDISSLRIIVSGAVALSASSKAALLRAAPHATILDTAGASETGTQMTHIASDPNSATSGSFRPGPGTCVLDESRSRCVTDGAAVGWLARSGAVPLGYLDDELSTGNTFPIIAGVRYAVPGDRARIREDGSIQLLGRDSATINSGGEKIFAEEVELAIAGHPDVYDVVVSSRPSERWGEEVIAIVQLRPDATATDVDLLSFAGTSLARYKLPKSIIFTQSIARSAAGKPDYRWAKQVASGGTQRVSM